MQTLANECDILRKENVKLTSHIDDNCNQYKSLYVIIIII